MSLNTSILNGHLTRIMEDLPVVATCNGSTISGVVSSPDVTQVIVLGGAEQEVQFQFFVKADTLTASFPIGSIFCFPDKKCKVLQVKTSPDNGNLISFQMGSAQIR